VEPGPGEVAADLQVFLQYVPDLLGTRGCGEEVRDHGVVRTHTFCHVNMDVCRGNRMVDALQNSLCSQPL